MHPTNPAPRTAAEATARPDLYGGSCWGNSTLARDSEISPAIIANRNHFAAEWRLKSRGHADIPHPWTAGTPYDYDHAELYRDADGFFVLADGSEAGWQHTMAWIDCLAGPSVHGIFMRANAAAAASGPGPQAGSLRIPFTPPVSLVNRLSLKPFNLAYYHLHRWRAGKAVAHYEPFLYPLDRLLEWNRMYGPRGFYQYQSVVPRKEGPDATRAMLQEISRSGEGSFLAVLKTFGDRPAPGMLSFPRAGVTLALDFPNRKERTLRLLERLDAITAEAGGALYPAKDARMPRTLFETGYPHLGEFLPFRDPGISSSMSRRLLGS